MRLKRGLPLVIFTILAVGVPILEVYLLIQIGQAIGVLPTIGLLVIHAILGGLLMRHQGARAWKALNLAYTKGKVPTGPLADAALILVGGVLLILPGFVTDAVGFGFLLPWTRPYARKMIAFFIARRIKRSGVPVAKARADKANLIKGETVEDAPPAKGRAAHEEPVVIKGELEDPPPATAAPR